MLEYILTGLVCLALISFVWEFFKKIIKNFIYISLLLLFVKFALHSKSYRINNNDLKEISIIASKNKAYDPIHTFDLIHKNLIEKYPDSILDQYEWQMCRYNGDIVSLSILHLSITEQIVFVGRKRETSRFISGNFMANMTEIIIKGSIKVWKDSMTEPNQFDQLNAGNILYTKPEKVTSSPSFDFFNSEKILVEYSADTWSFEVHRSILPLWIIHSFVSNVIHFDVPTLVRLSYVIIYCLLISIQNFISSVIDLAHDCCSSQNIIDFFK